jgi:predicted GNAT superfamily acetyltransferase
MLNVQYRRAEAGDYREIVRLNTTNFITNLSPQERKEGFLSAVFSEQQVAAIAGDLGIVVAVTDGWLVGFLCAFRNEFEHGSPVVAAMLESYDRVRFDSKLLKNYRSYVYGPVCIERAYRGKGVLRGLFEAQKRDLAGKFEIGVALVACANLHSLNAHVAGLGMTQVGDFEVNGDTFATVVFRLP